jgi:hypothetical protein
MYHEEEEEEEEEELDTSWVKHFKKEEQNYSEYYKEEVMNITLFFLYVGKNKEVETISNEQFLLEKNSIIAKDQLIQIIKQKQNIQLLNKKTIKYNLLSLYKFNIDLETEEINTFISQKSDLETAHRFFQTEKYLNDIKYNNTIHLFQDLNSLFFIFQEPDEKKVHAHLHTNTKKIIHLHAKKFNQRKTKRKTLY